MKQLKYISLACALLICMVGKGQTGYLTETNWHTMESKQGPIVNWKGQVIDTSTNVMLKIVLRRKPSYHFYREGYKRGDEYWYIDGNRIKKLPKGWYIWEWREIKHH